MERSVQTVVVGVLVDPDQITQRMLEFVQDSELHMINFMSYKVVGYLLGQGTAEELVYRNLRPQVPALAQKFQERYGGQPEVFVLTEVSSLLRLAVPMLFIQQGVELGEGGSLQGRS